jgi:hypothetical protein
VKAFPLPGSSAIGNCEGGYTLIELLLLALACFLAALLAIPAHKV